MDRGQCHAALCVAMRIAFARVRWALVLRRNVSVSRIFSSALRRPKAVLLEEMLLEGVKTAPMKRTGSCRAIYTIYYLVTKATVYYVYSMMYPR